MQKLSKLIMIVSLICIPFAVFAYVSPGKPVGFLNDFAGIISVQDRQNIESKLVSLNKSTGTQVSVVTISNLGNETVETYATKLFEEWGIGVKGKDNGILVLIAVNDHKMRIEVGYGLEGTVTDLQAGNIIRNVMTPAFKNNDFALGISGALDALSGLINKDPSVISTYSDTNNSSSNSNSPLNGNIFTLIFFAIIITLHSLAYFLGKTKSWWLGGVIGFGLGSVIGFIWGFVYAGFGAIIIFTILGLIFDYYVSKHPPKSGGRGGGIWPIFFGGGRGSSGGGGFGGFGGGGSGGGGASGGW